MRDADMIAVVGVLMRFNGADAPGARNLRGSKCEALDGW